MPGRHTAAPRCVDPATTTDHAEMARTGTSGVGLRETAVSVTVNPIAAPFTHVAAHVIQAKLVGSLCGDIVGGAAAVLLGPGHVV